MACHSYLHFPSSHLWFAPHWLKQPPHALLSFLKSKQRVCVAVWLVDVTHASGLSRGHLHCPSLHFWLEGHTLPQPPHATFDVLVLIHISELLGPGHFELPSRQSHLPSLHFWSRGQTLKQSPQWYSSFAVLAHTVTPATFGTSHSLGASRGQDLVHLPSMHFSFHPQRCQQPPQWFSFLLVLTHIVGCRLFTRGPHEHAVALSDGQPHFPLMQD
jgi:hypothetical protein